MYASQSEPVTNSQSEPVTNSLHQTRIIYYNRFLKIYSLQNELIDFFDFRNLSFSNYFLPLLGDDPWATCLVFVSRIWPA